MFSSSLPPSLFGSRHRVVVGCALEHLECSCTKVCFFLMDLLYACYVWGKHRIVDFFHTSASEGFKACLLSFLELIAAEAAI